MSESGLSPGKSGNLSIRMREGMLITPTGVSYATMTARDLVALAFDGTRRPGALLPSSEWPFHAAIYQAKPEAQAIVHTHSLHATALACLGRGIPAFHYMVAVAGAEDIRCAPYATFGSTELAAHAVAALDGKRRACLLANHGQVAIGRTIEAALALAQEVETLAAQYGAALALGAPALLEADEMARVLEKFATYGQQPAATPSRKKPASALGRSASLRRRSSRAGRN